MKNNKLSEFEVNQILTHKLKETSFFVLNMLRLTAVEFDVILFDPCSLKLINIEIKKNKWEILFHQALRGKLYCHYSMILVPKEAKRNIHTEPFLKEGIGIMYYEELEGDLDIQLEYEPQESKCINRNLKKQIYKQVQSKFKERLNA
jgi:hypothetical protein